MVYELEREQRDQLPPPEPQFQQNVEWTASVELLLQEVLAKAGHIDAVGHRIVHGGSRYQDPVRINTEVRQAIAGYAEIAPLHTGRELQVLDAAVAAVGPNLPQFAAFDTSFHRTLSPAAYTYAVPHDWLSKEGVRRYGFHGLSYQYAARRAAQLLGDGLVGRMVVCHLGSGASLCAIRDGKSVDTTMGFTPLEGLVMATRSGSIDPGVVFYLQHHKGLKSEDLDRMLNHESGLAALSGTSGDMRQVLAARDRGDARAALAFDVYMHSLVRHVGMMTAVLGGLDALVFTGGVGENNASVRETLCNRLAFLGVAIDQNRNANLIGDVPIHNNSSRVGVLVIHAREEWEIARACVRIS